MTSLNIHSTPNLDLRMIPNLVWKTWAVFEKNRWPEKNFIGSFRSAFQDFRRSTRSVWASWKESNRSRKLKKGYGNTEEFGKLEIENYCMGGTGVILSQGLMKEESDYRIKVFWLVKYQPMRVQQNSVQLKSLRRSVQNFQDVLKIFIHIMKTLRWVLNS